MFFKKHEKPPLREFNCFLLCYTGAKLRKIIGSASVFPKKVGENHHIFMGKFHKIPRNSLIFSDIL